MQWVIEHSPSKGADRSVLLMIAYHADPDGGQSWPSIETLAREARLSRRATCYAIASLVEAGEVEMALGGGRGHSNSYRISMVNSANDDINSANFAPFPERVQSKTVQSTTERVQSTTVEEPTESINSANLAPEPSLSSPSSLDTNKSLTNKKRDGGEVPQDLEEFDSILRAGDPPTYAPTGSFYSIVSSRCGALDLPEEAVKMTAWLQTDKARKKKRVLNTAFVLNWLKTAKEDRRDATTQRSTTATVVSAERLFQQSDSGGVSPFAKYC